MDFATGFDYAFGDGYYDDGFYDDGYDTPDFYDSYADYGGSDMLPAVMDGGHHFDYYVPDDSNAMDLLNYPDPLIHSHEYHSGWFALDSDCPECREIISDIENGNNQWGRRLVHVDPYFRDDGTFVEGHFRTAPDGIESNNFSSK